VTSFQTAVVIHTKDRATCWQPGDRWKLEELRSARPVNEEAPFGAIQVGLFIPAAHSQWRTPYSFVAQQRLPSFATQMLAQSDARVVGLSPTAKVPTVLPSLARHPIQDRALLRRA
jgi:hypothetical protein